MKDISGEWTSENGDTLKLELSDSMLKGFLFLDGDPKFQINLYGLTVMDDREGALGFYLSLKSYTDQFITRSVAFQGHYDQKDTIKLNYVHYAHSEDEIIDSQEGSITLKRSVDKINPDNSIQTPKNSPYLDFLNFARREATRKASGITGRN